MFDLLAFLLGRNAENLKKKKKTNYDQKLIEFNVVVLEYNLLILFYDYSITTSVRWFEIAPSVSWGL